MQDFNTASKEDLKQWAIDELNLRLPLTMSDETMRQKIVDECGAQGIAVPVSKLNDGKADQAGYVTIVIAKADKKAGSEPVPVSVQGVQYTIPRGIPIGVPPSVVEVLKNAVRTIYEQPDDGGDMIEEDVQSYPFQVLNDPRKQRAA